MPDIFDNPLQIIRTCEVESGFARVEHAHGGQMREIPLTPHQGDVLASLSPLTSNHAFSTADCQFLLAMAEAGAVAFITPDSRLDDFSFVLIEESEVKVFRAPFEDGFICIGRNGSFNISELGAAILATLDGKRTVGQIIGTYQESVLATPSGRERAQAILTATGRPYYAHLCDAAIAVTDGILRTGSGRALPV